MLIRLRSVKTQGMILHYPFYCVQKAVCRLADEHKKIKNQLLPETNPSNAQKLSVPWKKTKDFLFSNVKNEE
jgi:hypothetical protein